MDIIDRLALSKFRSSFYLKEKDINYINEKGIDKIQDHAFDLVRKNLYDYKNPKDGKQTPYKGHPVFIAMHATGCCCRGCLYKWHHISKDHYLEDSEIDYIVSIILRWINKQLKGD